MMAQRSMTRRMLMGGALAMGGALCAIPGGASQAQADEGISTSDEHGDGKQHGFIVNVRRCINCGHCVEACRLWNRTPEEEQARRRISTYQVRDGGQVHLSTSCMHCERPSCMDVCPAGAITKGYGGIVHVDEDRCIGCKYCYQACPYGVPHYNSRGMDKCDFCSEAGVALGDRPHCVRACKTGALRCGPLDELLAKSERVRRLDGPNGPSLVLR